jgi:hypothetical protein
VLFFIRKYELEESRIIRNKKLLVSGKHESDSSPSADRWNDNGFRTLDDVGDILAA